jgi:Domain of unknown function (DUF4157)
MSTAAPLQKTAAKSSPLATAKPLQIAGANVFLQRKCACGAGTSSIGGECEECSKKRLLRKSSGASGPDRVPPTVHEVLRSPGHPLDEATRSFFEQRFRHDFSRVRVHVDGKAPASARSINAHAYAVEQHVVFGAGRYRPDTPDGLHLIAHELAHTIQQRNVAATAIQACGAIEIGAADSPLEYEADRAADSAVSGHPIEAMHSVSRGTIQRNGSPEVAKIEDLLSYGIVDWAITDAEAVEALTRLERLSRIQQAEFVSDKKYLDRLRENLPDERVPELDAIVKDVSGLLPETSKVDAIIDKLSYGLLDWAITDAEAIEALEMLKTLSGERLAIALKRIDYGRLMDNLPESRRQELIDLLAAGLATGGTVTKAESKEPGTRLRSLDFVSDHGVMRNNSKDWSNEGKPYPQPDWEISESAETRSGAISHTMGRPLEIDLGFDVAPVTAAPETVNLSGKGSSPFLDFSATGSFGGGTGKRQHMMSSNNLPAKVAAYTNQSIDWTIKWGKWEHPIGTTGPLDIYATIDKPLRSDTVTTKRMAKAVELVASAPTLKPHDVVKTIMFTWTRFNLDVRYANEWDLAADMRTGAQCIDLVRFVQSVIGTVRLPGLAEAVIIWAQPSAPWTAIETPWGMAGGMSSGLIPPYPGQPTWHAMLLDGDFRPNNYEAALKFTADGFTKYYPGGVRSVLDHPDQVLRVFNCLAWFRVVGGGQYAITDVPGPYRPGECKVGARHHF